MKRVIVTSPASSANLGSGFDVFSIGLKDPVDTVELRASKFHESVVKVAYSENSSVHGYEDTAIRAVIEEMATEFGLKYKIEGVIVSHIPIGVGLGSSAASSVAAAVGTDKLFQLKLDSKSILRFAAEGELAASGSRHYDNIAGALHGGFVIVHHDSLETIKFASPKGMKIVIATPGLKLPGKKTKYARSLLPKNVGLEKMTKNVSFASRVVAGFANDDIEMIGSGLEDSVVEPARKMMIPWFDEVKDAALKSGAAGVCISGAGPSMMAIVNSYRVDPERVRKSMEICFEDHGISANSFITSIGEGTRIVRKF